jgi:diguanylate cyclase (GGDEF)-like protein/PAS domain S-box-containing protein
VILYKRLLGPLARLPLLAMLAVFGVLLVAFTWVATLWRIDDERELTRHNVETVGTAMSRAEEERAALLFRQVDLASRFLKLEYEGNDGLAAVTRALQRDDLVPTGASAVLAIADRDGQVVASSHSGRPVVTVADREYFLRLQQAADTDELFISAPVVSKASGRWMIPTSRRLTGPDGRFAGIVLVAIDVDYFTDFYDPATLGDHGAVALLGRDGSFRARRIGSQIAHGERLDVTSSAVLLGPQRNGTVTLDSPMDGVERIYSYRQLADFPVVVVYGVSKVDAYAAFERRRREYLAAAAIVSALCLAGGALLMVLGRGLQRGLKRAERSEYRLRTVTDQVPGLVSYVDTDQRFRFANRRYEEWLAIAPEHLIGRTLLEVYGETAYQFMRPHIEAAMAGTRVQYEHEFNGNGISRYVQVTAVPDRNDSGTVAGLFVLISDISMLKQAEESMRRSEDQLRLVADTLPMRVSFIDAEERYRFNNLAYERYFNIPRGSMYGKTMREIVGEEGYRELQPWVRRALAGETVTFTREPMTAEGIRSLELTYIPTFDVDGKTVLGFQAVINDVTTTKHEERRLRQLTQTDPLTGVGNRIGFQEQLERALVASRADGSAIAVMYLDVDRFKQINDSHGHAVGDALLKAFASRLVRALRITDVVARLGGDEFAILLSQLPDARHAGSVADKILENVRKPFAIADMRFLITTSIGIATVDGGAATAAVLLKVADESMYRAKQSGRDSWRSSAVAQQADLAQPRPSPQSPAAASITQA